MFIIYCLYYFTQTDKKHRLVEDDRRGDFHLGGWWCGSWNIKLIFRCHINMDWLKHISLILSILAVVISWIHISSLSIVISLKLSDLAVTYSWVSLAWNTWKIVSSYNVFNGSGINSAGPSNWTLVWGMPHSTSTGSDFSPLMTMTYIFKIRFKPLKHITTNTVSGL